LGGEREEKWSRRGSRAGKMGEKVLIEMMSAGREGSNSNIFPRLVYMPEADIWTAQEATST
jgi:hypothetical protein